MFTIGGAWTVLVPVLLGFAWHGPRCLRGVGGCYLWVLPTSPNRMVKPRYNFLLVQDAELAIRRGCLGFNCIKANYAWKSGDNWAQPMYHLPSILLWKSQALRKFRITFLGMEYGSPYWKLSCRMMMIRKVVLYRVPLNRWWGYVGSKYGNAAEISLKATWH